MMGDDWLSLIYRMRMYNNPSDHQLDLIDDEFHLIMQKKSKRPSAQRAKIVKQWRRHRQRMGYPEDYEEKKRKEYSQNDNS